MSFSYGIEYEFGLQRADGEFVDFSTSHPQDLQSIVNELPVYQSDYPSLRIGDLGLKLKRWYVEGYERFDERGRFLCSDPKGIEIRTPICHSIEAAVQTLRDDFIVFDTAARRYDLQPVAIGFNPYRDQYQPLPALNAWERAARSSPEERSAHLIMVTYGPDVSISSTDLSAPETIDVGLKLTYYSPFIVAFSLNSPFHLNACWGGLSRRVLARMPARPSVLVFLDERDKALHRPSNPSLTQIARVPAEAGRIEFKGLDCCGNFDLYGSVLTLIKGLILDSTLTGRRLTPDGDLHHLAARSGFSSEAIAAGAHQVLEAAQTALTDHADRRRLGLLADMLRRRESPAHLLLARYEKTRNIAEVLRHSIEWPAVALSRSA